MELKINVDNDQLNDIIVASLKEYFEYLNGAVWPKEEAYRQKVRDAFVLVLEQYLTPKEYEEYIAKFVN